MNENPNLIATTVSSVGGLVLGLTAFWLKVRLSRNDMAGQILSAQTQGWDAVVDQLNKLVLDLRNEVDARERLCEQRIKRIEELRNEDRARISNLEDKYRECTRQHEQCQLRVAALERLIGEKK